MALTKRIGFGVQLECDPTGGSTLAALGAIVDGIDGSESKTTEVDTSLLVDKVMTKSGAQIDPGNVTFKIAYDPKDTGSTQILTSLLLSSFPAAWQVVYPTIGSETPAPTDPVFQGFVSSFKVSRQKASMVTADVTITLSGSTGLATGS